jgi:predicted Rossmann fold flavoprotein
VQPDHPDHAHTAIIGAGAAGLMAAIQAGRAGRNNRVVVFDSAHRPGAKILISGGGRCNVTHHEVDATAFAGSSRNAIGKVLRGFDVRRTMEFFEELGVELNREDTGKLFPVSDDARTVLDALLQAASRHTDLITDTRVQAVTPHGDGFEIATDRGHARADRVILATGGRSIPKSGSDGHGYEIARALGHSVTRTFPALVPLTLPKGHWITQLSGLSTDAEFSVLSRTGKKLHSASGSALCTHFGLSGPATLDISRFLIAAQLDDPESSLAVNWIPGATAESLVNDWKSTSRTVGNALKNHLPGRLTEALCGEANTKPGTNLDQVNRPGFARLLTEYRLPVSGNRGYNYAEVTAGGVPLDEIHLTTMESRIQPGLYLCGEICDVDGRIGGFNFQWAWSSGYLAGGGSQRD